MTRNPTTITDQASVRAAEDLLRQLDVRHLPVVNAEGELVGMLSDRDLRWPASGGLSSEAVDDRVASHMNANVVSVDMEADAYEIIDLMIDQKIGAVPVVDGERSLVGIVSYVDVLRELASLLE